MDFAKILEGVELVDAELESLGARKAELEGRVAQLSNAVEAAKTSLDEVAAAYETRAALPGVADRAMVIMTALEAAGCSEDAVRAAVVAQFGKKAPPAPVLPKKPPTALKEKKITLSISEERQNEILAAVQAAGAEGIRMETLYDRFGAVEPNDKTAIFGTVKNALIDKKVTPSGQARGMRYTWNS
jgi:hypothetical protein